MEITLILNDDSFEYDIYGLVKAFYPAAEIKRGDDESGDFIRLYFDAYIKAKVSIGGEIKENIIRVKKENSRSEIKNIIKRLVYGLLSGISKKNLPWGTLTGIRPTKIFTGLIEEGKCDDEIRRYVSDTYLISDEKSDLALSVAHKENELLKNIDYKSGYSLYIGIPFCPTTCLYCSFSTFPLARWKDKVEDYISALEKEMSFCGEAMKKKTLQTVYIGGGTPTTLNKDQLKRLFDMTEKYFDTSEVLEWTIEAGRPDSLDREKLEVIKASGANRISINPQTMNNETLKLIGRHHFAEDFTEKFQLARSMGIDNINTDIILGLPKEGREELKVTLDKLKELAPDSLTVHSLALKRAAKLSQKADILNPLYDAQSAMEQAFLAAREMGAAPYYLYRQKNMTGNLENIGFAKEGRECLYNILIMEEKQPIISVGAGSVTKLPEEGRKLKRIENVKDVNFYIGRIDEMIERKRLNFGVSDIDKCV